MSSQLSGGYDSESVIPFAPAAKNAAPLDSADQLDKAGHNGFALNAPVKRGAQSRECYGGRLGAV